MRRFALEPGRLGVALAVVVFVWSWVFLDHSFYLHRKSTDAVYYQSYAVKVQAGEVPYRDFAVQYPPGSLAVFLAPTLVSDPADLAAYEKWFSRLMCLLGICCLLLVIRAHPPPWGLALVALSPLLIGRLGPERFDLWPAAQTIARSSHSSTIDTGSAGRRSPQASLPSSTRSR